MTRHGSHTESRMRENCTYGSMRGRAYPAGASRSTLLPEKRMMRRVAQIGGGKIFGSAAFVLEMVFALGERFKARHVPARAVEDIGFATHGWRLAKEVAA